MQSAFVFLLAFHPGTVYNLSSVAFQRSMFAFFGRPYDTYDLGCEIGF